jgi:exopolysaccharide production protein ExoZ
LLSIQYLRGVAAIGVLIFHAADATGRSFRVGGSGVDIFFVISGLIMWTIGARRPLTPGEFLLRRVIRVVPLYWFVTLALAGTWLILPNLLPNLSPTPSDVLLSLFFIPHYDPTGQIVPLLVPGWTLNYEAFFYVVFAATLLTPLATRLWLLTAILAAFVVGGFLLKPTGAILITYTDPLLLEFVAGAWIAKAAVDGRTLPPGLAVGALLAGVLGLAAGAVGGVDGADIGAWRVVVWGIPAALIVAGAMGLEAAGRVPSLRLPKFLGDASYSTYLVHALAVAFAVKVTGVLGLPASSVLSFAGAILAGLVAGIACFLIVERPLLRRLRPRADRVRLTEATAPGG